MKRLLCLALALTLALTLTACGDGGGDGGRDSAQNGDTTALPQDYVGVGVRCPATQLTEIDRNGYTDRTFDPTATGKITVINFWAYWCPPCVQELPHFEQAARAYADEVSIVAIHCDTLESAQAFLGANYPDSAIRFAMDPTGAVFDYYSALGGTGSIPYTVVLDARGVICRTFVGAINYDTLVGAIQDCRQ